MRTRRPGAARPGLVRRVAAVLCGAAVIVLGFQLQARAAVDSELQAVDEQLQTFLDTLGTLESFGPLADALPLGDVVPGEALDLAAAVADLKQALADEIPSLEDAADLESALDGLDDTYAGVAVTVDGPDGGAVIVNDGADVVDVILQITATRQVDVPLDFATGLVDLIAAGGGTNGTFPVDVTLATSVLHFELDKALAASEATAGHALSLRTLTANPAVDPAETPSLRLTAQTSNATLDDFTTNLGFTAVTVDGSLSFDLSTLLAIGDPDDPTPFDGTPNGDQRISADEWTATALEDLLQVTVEDDPATDAVFAEITLDTDLTADDPDVTITYTDASLTDGVTPTPELDPLVPDIADLENFSAEEALAAVGRLVSWLRALQSSGRLDLDLPFISGLPNDVADPTDTDARTGSFSDALSIARALEGTISDATNGIGAVVDDGTPPAETQPSPTFSNAQELATKLSALLGLSIAPHWDIANHRLEFALSLDDSDSGTTVLDFGNLDVLSGIGLDTGDALAQIDADYDLDLTFALDLTDQPTEDGGPIGSCTDGIDNAAEDLDPATTADGADAGDTECAGIQTLEQRVAVEVGTGDSPELTARMGIGVTDLDAVARIGMLEAGISGGALAVATNAGEDGTGPGSCVGGGDEDGDGDIDLADDDCRALLTLDINEAGGDGWLTIEDLINAMGAAPPAGVTIGGTVDAALDAVVPVSAELGGVAVGSGDITATATYDGPLNSDALGGLIGSLDIDADEVRTSDLMSFSPCGNTLDDDGDGIANDGCGGAGDPAAVDDAESSTLAMLTQILAGLRGLAQSLDAGGLLPAGTLDAPIPFLGASFDDLLSYGDTLLSLATNIEDAGEDALEASGLDADACSDDEDSDFDGIVDDGCPTAPGADNLPETDCLDGDGVGDDDGDGDINDGCPATIPSLQGLAAQLDGYLTNLLDQVEDSDGPGGVSVADETVAVTLQYEPATKDIVFGLDIVDLTIDRNIPFNLDLPGDISELVALDASGELALDVVGDLSLDFGIELDDFTPFLLETTEASIAATGSINDIQFGAGVGPLQILVGEPTAKGEDTLGFACDNDVDDDGDGTADDCGDSPVADRGRFSIGGELSIVQDDVAGSGTKAYLPGGPSPTAAFTLDAGGTPQAECDDVITADTPKHACAILPLYFDNGSTIVPIGSFPTGNKVLATVTDLADAFDGNPADAVQISYDTSQLEDFIKDQLIDLLLLNSGLGDLLDRLQQFLDDTLLSFPLPLIGDKLDDAASIVQSLRDGLKEAVSQTMAGTNPLDGGGLTPGADFVQSTMQSVASAIGEKLDGDGTDDIASLLLDSDDAGDDVTEADLRATIKCGDGGSRDCDTGFGEADPANPALPPGDDLTDNCTGNTDDDGDGVANDGCEAVADPETLCQAGTEEDPDVDEDGDGTPDDGCDGSPAVAGDSGDGETDCTGNGNEDTDTVANDGCVAVAEPAANVTDIQLRAKLGKHDISPGAFPVNFDKSIPGLGIKVSDVALEGDIDWDIDFGFGISKDQGFYFLTDDPDELLIHAGIDLSGGTPAHLEGSIAFLKLTADDLVGDADGKDSGLSADFGVNILDPNPTGGADRLTFGDLQGVTSFDKLLQYSLSAGVDVDLQLATGFDGNVGLPELQAQLHLAWTWGIGSMTSDLGKLDPDACGDGSSCLQLSLDNVQLSLGSFITNFLKPVFGDIQRFTKPFDPIIEKINEPIPVLSDLAGEPITLLTLAETFGPSDQNYDLIIDIVKLVDFINSLDFTGSDILIPLGNALGDAFSLDGAKLQNKKLDPTQARQAFTTNIDGLPDMLTKPGGINDGAGSIGSSELKVGGLKDIGVSFPFLENPSKMLGILFGQDVDLILWEPDPLSIGFSYSQKFGPIWQVPPVFLEIGGSVSVTGTFGIGYSSKGLRAAFFDNQGPAGLLRGLFLVDRHPLEGGPDSNELELRGELFANAQVSVVIFSAGAQGSVFLTIGIDLQDPNSDGRLEFVEAADVIRTTGNVLCIFNLNGQFGVAISVFAEVDLFFWSQRWTKTLAKIILYEFKVECDPLADPILATQEGGTLTLNIGPRRHLRDPDGDGTPDGSIGFDVVNEQFVITKVGDGLVTVSGLGYVQPYGSSADKITKVVADGGTGNDVITLADGVVGEESECADLGETTLAALDDDGDGKANDGCQPKGPAGQEPPEGETDCDDIVDDDGDGFVNDGCKTVGIPIPFTGITGDLDGGPGEDQITGGLDADTIDGDGGAAIPGYDSSLPAAAKADGNDQLNGREGVNTISGGGANDMITSGSADDFLYGNAGNDTIDAGLGGDHVEGGDGEDAIDGGRSTANTTVQPGKPGVPQTGVTDGVDTIYGDVKDDPSIGGRDTIDAGDGGDFVYGGPGGDRINGGNGNDTIEGGDETGDAACLSSSNDPDDVIVGGPGADTIDAQDGDDIVVGGSIVAGQPDDGDIRLDGGDGCDVVIGDNATFSSASNPRAFTPVDPTLGGGDVIRGGNGDDIIQGQTGADVINGDDIGDAADTGDGADVIRADDGDDIVQGDGGNDRIHGGTGDDDIAGGNGNDEIYGEAGIDFLLGDNGSVAKNGAGRADDDATMSGGTGVDVIRGGSEPDKIYGQGSGDTIYGDAGTDELYGDGDDAEASHVAADGNDTIYGGIHDDLIYGNNGADTLYGESGDDRIGGGSPNATSADDGHRLSTGAACAPPAAGCFQDRIFGDFGVDVIAGDNATFSAPGDTPTLLAEATIGGDDLIYGQGFNDKLYGENGDDDLYGGDGDDHIEGGDDSDDLYGEADQDDLIGGTTEHADVIPAGATNGQPDGGDRLHGGGNADVLAGDNAEITRPGGTHPGGAKKRDVTIDDLDFGAGSLSGNDELSGGIGGDELYGGAEDDQLWGNNQADTSPLLDGDDHLEGNDGSDDLFGHGGQDDLIGGTSAEAGPPGDPGGAHPDVDDVLRGGDGHDVLAGDNASIQVVLDTSGTGDALFLDDLDVDRGIVDVVRRRVVLYDIATVDAPIVDVGRSGGDQLWGEGDHDQAYGQGGGDLLDGGASDDHLEGNAGEDVAFGQGGQDDIIGGTGRTISDDPTTASDRRLDEGDELFGGDGDTGDGAHLEDDYDVIMGDNATILRGSEQGTLGAAWTVNTFNASVKRYLFLYDVAEVGKTPQAHDLAMGPDLMRGQADDDVMYGQGDGDDMEGGGGDDYMEGNDDADTMSGQAGNDDMLGGTGPINTDPPTGVDGRHDRGELGMSGGSGFDWMAGDNAVIRRVLDEDGAWVPSTFNGGMEHLRIWLRDVNSDDDSEVSGGDVMNGDGDDDVMYGQANGDDAGDDVNDVIHGNGGDDYMEGNAGADLLFGDDQQDDQIGGTGLINDDPPTGVDGRWDMADVINGGNHADFQLGDNGKIERPLDEAGLWTYFVEYNPTTVKRVATRFDVGGASEAFGDDVMNGDAGDDYQWGQDGNDLMHGNDDNDDMYGELGDDEMYGDRGEDAMVGDRGNIRDTKLADDSQRLTFDTKGPAFFAYVGLVEGQLDRRVSLTDDGDGAPYPLMGMTTGGNDRMRGGPGHDSMHGAFGDDLMNGDSGGDWLFGHDGADVMWGGKGADPTSGDPADTPTPEDGEGTGGPQNIRGVNDRFVDYLFGGHGGLQTDEVEAADILDYLPRAANPGNGFPGDPAAWFEMTSTGDLDASNDQYHQGIDWIYGGYNRDVMEGDVGKNGPDFGDRLIDWLGAYNLYTRCNSSYGDDGDIRQISPEMLNFLKALAYGSGAGYEPSEIHTEGTSSYRELGLVYPGTDSQANKGVAFPTTPGHFQLISCQPGTSPA